jgi:hypothetical protein
MCANMRIREKRPDILGPAFFSPFSKQSMILRFFKFVNKFGKFSIIAGI